MTTFTCQNCDKTGTIMTDFKKMGAQTKGIRISWIMCNDCVKASGYEVAK